MFLRCKGQHLPKQLGCFDAVHAVRNTQAHNILMTTYLKPAPNKPQPLLQPNRPIKLINLGLGQVAAVAYGDVAEDYVVDGYAF